MINELISRAQAESRKLLTETESKGLLEKAGISVVNTRLAESREKAIAFSREIGFPVVMKIASPDIVHKSDSGGVKLNLKNVTQVGKAYSEIMVAVAKNCPQAQVDGVTIQKMAPPGVEVIIGMSKDAQFGPVIMFGLGGVWVELLKDVSFRIAPLSPRDAREMIQEIKGFPLLNGYRGQPPVDVSSLEALILKVSEFVEAHTQIKELDLNPVIAYPDGALAVDARIVLEDLTKGE